MANQTPEWLLGDPLAPDGLVAAMYDVVPPGSFTSRAYPAFHPVGGLPLAANQGNSERAIFLAILPRWLNVKRLVPAAIAAARG